MIINQNEINEDFEGRKEVVLEKTKDIEESQE